MRRLSMRDGGIEKNAGFELPSTGGNIKVSTSVRLHWRKMYANVPSMLGTNDFINLIVASDYQHSTPTHRFILRDGQPAEIRAGKNLFYVAIVRKNGEHDIIVVQPNVKHTSPQVSTERLTQRWLDKVFSGEIKRRAK